MTDRYSVKNQLSKIVLENIQIKNASTIYYLKNNIDRLEERLDYIFDIVVISINQIFDIHMFQNN